MPVAYNCPTCYDDCYNMAYDDNADIEENDTLDFACEECGCEFEVTFNNPTVYITKKSTKEGGE